MKQPLDPFLYQYLIGGIVFFVGVVYAYRQQYISFEGKGLRNLIILFAGLGFFSGLQGYLQYANMNTREVQSYPCASAENYETCFSALSDTQQPPVLTALTPEQRKKTQEAAQNIEIRKLDHKLRKKKISQEEYDKEMVGRSHNKMGSNLDFPRHCRLRLQLAGEGVHCWSTFQ